MSTQWFRVQEVGTGTIDDPHRPKYTDRVDGYSAFPVGNSPQYVMRAYADDATLESIASESDSQELSANQALDLYNSSAVSSLKGSNRPVDRAELERRQGVR